MSAVLVACSADDPSLAAEVIRAVISQGCSELVVVGEESVLLAVVDNDVQPKMLPVSPETPLGEARNIGADAAANRLVAFLDPDAVPQPGWLDAIQGAFATEGVAMVGGPVRPVWPDGHVPFLFKNSRAAGHFLSMLDLGHERIDVPRVFPGNMVIDLESVGERPFETESGRRPGSLIGAEEIPMMVMARRSGMKIVYEPGAAVAHHSRSERMNWRWMWRRAFAAGRDRVRNSRDLDAMPEKRTVYDIAFQLMIFIPYVSGSLFEKVLSLRANVGS